MRLREILFATRWQRSSMFRPFWNLIQTGGPSYSWMRSECNRFSWSSTRASSNWWRWNFSRTRSSCSSIWICPIKTATTASSSNHHRMMSLVRVRRQAVLNLAMITCGSSRRKSRYSRVWSTSWAGTSRRKRSSTTLWPTTSSTFTRRWNNSKCSANTSSRRKSNRSTWTDWRGVSRRWRNWQTNSHST